MGWMRPSATGPSYRQGHVGAVGFQPLIERCGFQSGLARIKRRDARSFNGVDGCPKLLRSSGGNEPELLHQLGNLALFAQSRDPDPLKRGQILRSRNGFEQPFRQRFEVGEIGRRRRPWRISSS